MICVECFPTHRSSLWEEIFFYRVERETFVIVTRLQFCLLKFHLRKKFPCDFYYRGKIEFDCHIMHYYALGSFLKSCILSYIIMMMMLMLRLSSSSLVLFVITKMFCTCKSVKNFEIFSRNHHHYHLHSHHPRRHPHHHLSNLFSL